MSLERLYQIKVKQTQCIISWYADKYKKTIFRPANLDKKGVRSWTDSKGNKLLCFWDLLRDRYTTAKNPLITYRSIQ